MSVPRFTVEGATEEDPRGDLLWGSMPKLAADAASRFGDADAVVDGDTRLSFNALVDRSLEVTRAIAAAGIEPGDRVALWAPNMAQWVTCALGVLGAGAVLVPLNTRFKGAEAAHVLRASRAPHPVHGAGLLGHRLPRHARERGRPRSRAHRAARRRPSGATATWARLSEPTLTDEVPIFTWPEFLLGAEGVVEGDHGIVGVSVSEHDARNRWQQVGAEDLSDIIFTSGTTGRPKGVMTTHAQTLRTFAAWASVVGLTEGDRYLIVNPFFHTFGYKAGILACLMTGATIVPEPVFDVDAVLARIERSSASRCCPVHRRCTSRSSTTPGAMSSTFPACAWR